MPNKLQATEHYNNVAVGIYSAVRIAKRGSNHDIAHNNYWLQQFIVPDKKIQWSCNFQFNIPEIIPNVMI